MLHLNIKYEANLMPDYKTRFHFNPILEDNEINTIKIDMNRLFKAFESYL